MNQIILIAQNITAILIIICILLQQRGQALGSAFGGEGSFYSTQRGIQKKLSVATVVLIAIFIVLLLSNTFFN